MNERFVNEVNSKVALIELEFFEKHCKRCIGTQLQKERDCAKFKGHKFLCCDKKGNYIQRHIRPESNRIMRELIEDMLNKKHTDFSPCEDSLN